MGELIKTYGNVNIGGNNYDIELNAPIFEKTGGTVHIQNEKSRIEMSQYDFYQMICNMNLALENLKIIKGDLDE